MDRSSNEKAPNNNADKMPVMFVGHGNPMNAIEDNRWSRGFASLGAMVPTPKAVLAISAHWYLDGTYLTSDARPKTIHDFGGFPRALYEVEYPAPGRPDLAQTVRDALTDHGAALSGDWGLDHGTWSELKWMFPKADVPVVQLSIDRRLNIREHFSLARSLSALRHHGVLVVGSGNIVHNLRDAFGQIRAGTNNTPDWAQRFDGATNAALQQHDTDAVLRLLDGNDDARLAHPTPEHFLPLVYTAALAEPDDTVRSPIEGFDAGSLSMRTVLWG